MYRRARQHAGRRRSTCAPISSSAATAGIRPCANAPASQVEDIGAPMDVLWFRLPKKPADPGETMGRFDAGAHHRSDRPRRLLAMRLRDSARVGSRRPSAPGCRRSGRPSRRSCPCSRTAVGELKDWDRDQALDRRGRPARALASAGAALHRRRRARDVAGRRRRRQSGGAGRGGGSQYPVAAAEGRNADARTTSTACRSGASFRPASSSACRCSCRIKVVDRALGADKAIDAPLRAAADGALCAAAPHPGAHRRHGRAAGARAHAG